MCKYAMEMDLNILNHLGINLYSNISAVISEVIANSWDADAENVYIDFNGEKPDKITIFDDGDGMDLEDINKKFLHVGYQKRLHGNITAKKRKVMGRKGIGKLSLFSIANKISIYSKKNGEINAFVINVEDLKMQISEKKSKYYPTEVEIPDFKFRDKQIDKGTMIIIEEFNRNFRKDTLTGLRTKIARRFNIFDPGFKVLVNDEEITLNDRNYFSKIKYIWYYGKESQKYADLCLNKISQFPRMNNWIEVDGGRYEFTGWIGTVEAAGDLSDGANSDNLNHIVITARGKVGQEDILSEFNEGGLYSKYIIGEIQADFFEDDDSDMATSNRQEYIKNDLRYIKLKSKIREELKEIEKKWTDLRNGEGEKKAIKLVPSIKSWLGSLEGDDKEHARKILGKVNQVLNEDEDSRKEMIKYSVLAFEKLKRQKLLSQLDSLSANNLESIGKILNGIDDVEATMYYQIINDRLQVIQTLRDQVNNGDLEKVIQEHLYNHLWLLDPSWERVDGTIAKEVKGEKISEQLNAVTANLTDEEKRARFDLQYRTVADKYIIIELKRANIKIDKEKLRTQISKYSDVMDKVLDYRGNYEIICVLGKQLTDNLDEKQKFSSSIEPFNARVVYYDELLQQAYQAYAEYFEKKRELNNILLMFEEIADN